MELGAGEALAEGEGDICGVAEGLGLTDGSGGGEISGVGVAEGIGLFEGSTGGVGETDGSGVELSGGVGSGVKEGVGSTEGLDKGLISPAPSPCKGEGWGEVACWLLSTVSTIHQSNLMVSPAGWFKQTLKPGGWIKPSIVLVA